MISLALSTFAQAMNGQLICSESMTSMQVASLLTDSRAIQASEKTSTALEAFLALKGPNFDGHRFVQKVIGKGCRIIIVEHEIPDVDSEQVAQIIVDDTRLSLIHI